MDTIDRAFLVKNIGLINTNVKQPQSSYRQGLRPKQHHWVTVVNPSNHRLLLHACDDCGVVKSENSVIRNCKGARNNALISGAQSKDLSQIA